jgi:anti-sigma B factor antagonist
LEQVVVLRCQGRIVAGAEVNALQTQLDKHTVLRKRVVLNLAEVDYIDSSGVGALVRAYGVLRSSGGGLKLCQLSPFVLQVLEVTHLNSVLPTYSTEAEAIDAFSDPAHHDAMEFSRNRIVCIDPSKDLLAYVRAVLAGAGYEVHTAWNLADGKNMVNAMKPQMLICGAGIAGLPLGEALLERFRQSGPNVHVLELPPDFSTAEAGQAGTDLVNRVKSLLA